jgi:hypothetical protein
MSWLVGTTAVVVIGGAAIVGAAIPGHATLGAPGLHGVPVPLQDPACDWLGWRHPLCAGGAFSAPVDDGIPGDNAAEGGIPAPAMVPNIDGSMSPPGTPGAI